MKSLLIVAALFCTSITIAQDGTLDPTFGSGGITTRNTGLVQGNATITLVLPDNKIIHVGTSRISGYKNIVVLRLTANGVVEDEQNYLLPFFGGPLAPDNTAFDAVLNPAGGFYVLGRFLAQNTPSVIWKTSILRFDAAGTNTGIFDMDLGFGADATKMAVQADGKLIITGGTGGDFRSVRLNTNFTVDATFGTAGTGYVTTPIGATTDQPTDILVQADGGILIGGYSHNGTDNDFALVRYLPTGVLDPTFDGDGIFINNFGLAEDYIQAVALQADGKIVATGTSGSDIALLRLLPTGAPDPLFGTVGKVTTNLGSTDAGTSLVITADNKILVGGYSLNGNNDFAAVRYTATGSLDAGFGTGGTVEFNLRNGSGSTAAETSDDLAFSIAIQNGNVILGGIFSNPGTFNYGFVVTRLLNTIILPLQLKSFDGRLENNTVSLKWTTVNEEGTSHFDIERSGDGRTFTTIGTVTAAAYSTTEKQYAFNDRTTNSKATLYYRLRMVDRDGRFSYSKILPFKIDGKEWSVVLYPNPVIQVMNLTLTSTENDAVQYSIIDGAGKIVREGKWAIIEGTNSLKFDLSEWAKGIYNLRLKGQSTSQIIPFIKSK